METRMNAIPYVCQASFHFHPTTFQPGHGLRKLVFWDCKVRFSAS